MNALECAAETLPTSIGSITTVAVFRYLTNSKKNLASGSSSSMRKRLKTPATMTQSAGKS